MRISDWSSDVCSSDLVGARKPAADEAGTPALRRSACSSKRMASAAMPAFLSPAFLSFVSSACAPDAAPSTTAAARIQPRRAATRKPTTTEFLSIAPRRGLALPSRRRPRPDWPAAHSPDPLFRLFPAGYPHTSPRARFFCTPDPRLTLGDRKRV